jgi:hypothetical protein
MVGQLTEVLVNIISQYLLFLVATRSGSPCELLSHSKPSLPRLLTSRAEYASENSSRKKIFSLSRGRAFQRELLSPSKCRSYTRKTYKGIMQPSFDGMRVAAVSQTVSPS